LTEGESLPSALPTWVSPVSGNNRISE
jgi:hypothetical protein